MLENRFRPLVDQPLEHAAPFAHCVHVRQVAGEEMQKVQMAAGIPPGFKLPF